MKKDLLILLILTLAVFAVFYKALLGFFAQDDFILISQFSQNGLWQNLINVFGVPTVTHWRPLHNLYFLIAGGLFGKNYIGYHLLTFFIHVLGSFFVYKVSEETLKNRKAAFIAAVFYSVSPIHFVSLFWISGSATMIGFMFLAAAFYFYLKKRFFLAVLLFVASLLASEAMAVGALVFLAWGILKGKVQKFTTVSVGAVAGIFGFVQLVLFKAPAAVDAYKIEFSRNILTALKYYILRVPGFIEGAGINIVSALLAVWFIIVGYFLAINILKSGGKKIYIFWTAVTALGVFPFILIPNHLSPHYMNISLWGLAVLVGLALEKTKNSAVIFLMAAIIIIDVWGTRTTENDNCVIKRANRAKTY